MKGCPDCEAREKRKEEIMAKVDTDDDRFIQFFFGLFIGVYLFSWINPFKEMTVQQGYPINYDNLWTLLWTAITGFSFAWKRPITWLRNR
jgi:hypothetical protein